MHHVGVREEHDDRHRVRAKARVAPVVGGTARAVAIGYRRTLDAEVVALTSEHRVERSHGGLGPHPVAVGLHLRDRVAHRQHVIGHIDLVPEGVLVGVPIVAVGHHPEVARAEPCTAHQAADGTDHTLVLELIVRKAIEVQVGAVDLTAAVGRLGAQAAVLIV